MSVPTKTVSLSKGNKDVKLILALFEKMVSWHLLDRLPSHPNIQELLEGKYICGEPPMPIGPYNMSQLLNLFRKWRTEKSGYATIGRELSGDALKTVLEAKVPSVRDLISTALEHQNFTWKMPSDTKAEFDAFVKCVYLPSSLLVFETVRIGFLQEVSRMSVSRGKEISKGRDAYFRKYKQMMITSQAAFTEGLQDTPPTSLVPYRALFNMLYKQIEGTMAINMSHSNGTDLTDYFVNDNDQLSGLRLAMDPDMKAKLGRISGWMVSPAPSPPSLLPLQ